MKILVTENQLNRIINEVVSVKDIDDVNWYGLISKGRNVWKNELNKIIKVPNEFYSYISTLLLSFTTNMKDSFQNDVKNGTLSQSTLDIFNKSVVSAINDINKDPKLNNEIQKIPPYQRKLAKSVGAIKIKSGVDQAMTLTGQKFFKEGFVQQLKIYDGNSPIVQNYIKVSNQMGDQVSNNKYLKNFIYNFIIGKL